MQPNCNYETLIIAGLGAVGSSLLRLGHRELQSFRKVVLVDKDADLLGRYQGHGFLCRTGSVEDHGFLGKVVSEVETNGLFVNLCANTDNVRLRRFLALSRLAYLDICASVTDTLGEHRFSRIMEYTRTLVSSRYPHWLCWGVNPGLVEIITRKIIRDFQGRDVEVTVYEHDQLHTAKNGAQLPVGWCPQALVEEVMLAPTLVVRDGAPKEDEGCGARQAVSFWGGNPVPARVVAHEDIWNLAMIAGVRQARFLYSLAPGVMKALAGDLEAAKKNLRMPSADCPVFGLEQLAVHVQASGSEEAKTLLWQTDHHEVWKRYGVNGVQYQTAKSLLFAMGLLQHTPYGTRAGSYCASDLPIAPSDWGMIDNLFAVHDIDWRDGSHLGLSFGEEELPVARQCERLSRKRH